MFSSSLMLSMLSKKIQSAAIILAMLTLFISQASLAADKNPLVAWDKISNGATVIDVRSPAAFAAGHLPNAINIPFQVIVEEFSKRGITKDTSLVLYCRSGNRSGIAFDAIVAEGYTKAYNGGGYGTLMTHSKKPAN